MAYIALISLKETIKSLSSSTIFPGQEVENVSMEVKSLKEFMESEWRWPRTGKDADVMERQIADAIYELEDVLESFVTIESLSRFASYENVKQEISCFLEAARKFKVETLEFNTMAEDKLISSNYSLSGDEQNMMVGFEDDIIALMHRLTSPSSRREILSIVGMRGIGKTTLVKEVYRKPFIRDHFHMSVFVTIGQRCSVRKILLNILVQISGSQVDKWKGETDDQLLEHIYKSLEGRRYLIVLDDVWDFGTFDDLKMIFPDERNGSRIIITTTMLHMAVTLSLDPLGPHVMRFMSVTESWALLRKVTFAEGESCPPELESLGRKIAQNSQGLPIEIIWVGSLLSKREKTIEFWKEVAENYGSFIADDDDEMPVFKRLYSSYENLPPELKACFLYMGVFPRNYAIPASKLMGLWVSEGFFFPEFQSLEHMAEDCLRELVNRSIVIIHERSSIGEIKTCRLHHLFWHFCVTEAQKINFFHVINGLANVFPKARDIQRRLCIRKNIVFAIKDMHELMGSISKTRSLLCIAVHHQYPLPVSFEFKVLRVLDVLSIRFYNFPLAILKLIRLRYLAITFNGELPASISVLGRLRIFIVRPHIRIRSCRSNQSFLPMDIWKMKKLRHLYIIGSDLPNPCGNDRLPKLQILSGVSPQSCTIDVLEGIQLLKKLGIRIELTPGDDAAEPLRPFDHLFVLHQLESFKCVVVNPNFEAQIIKLPDSNSIFPFSSIRKISLSGCGLPWNDIKKISWLPCLEVMKLRENAFTGTVWDTPEDEFVKLRFLLLESMDLVYWRANYPSYFPSLESLVLKHCYQLKEIPSEIGEFPSIQLIELVDCSHSASDLVKRIEEELTSNGDDTIKVRVTSSILKI